MTGWSMGFAREFGQSGGYHAGAVYRLEGLNNPLKAKIMISTSGPGQMLPIPMNEFMQQNFAAVGMQIDFDVVEWGTMLVAVRSDPKA
jgi:ABC-type transport system substrate-binding protein